MPRLAIVLAGLALGGALVNTVLGIVAGLGYIGIRSHVLVAIPTSILGLAGWTVVVLHFAGSHAWVRETVTGAGLDQALIDRSLAIRRGILPWAGAAVLGLVATYVLGGGADTGAVRPAVHLGLSLVTVFLHLVACYRTIILAGMSLDLVEMVEREMP